MSSQNFQVALLASQGLNIRERDLLIEKLTGQAAEQAPERLLRRAEVARRLSCSLRLVDLLAVKGTLTRVKLLQPAARATVSRKSSRGTVGRQRRHP